MSGVGRGKDGTGSSRGSSRGAAGGEGGVLLPVNERPRLASLQFYAFPVAILETMPGTEDWILANFVQLAYDKREQCPVRFSFFVNDFSSNPWLEAVRLNTAWVARSVPDIVDFLVEQVSQGYYCYLLVDEFHVPRRHSYGSHHLVHDLLVHGYDRETRTFQVLGYDERFRFTSVPVAFDAIRAAWHAQDLDSGNPFVLFRPKGDAEYAIRPSLVRRDVAEYLAAENTSARYSEVRSPYDRFWGTDVYDPFGRELATVLDGECRIDVRGPRVFLEHKKLMMQRIRRVLPAEAADRLVDAGRPVESFAWRLMLSATEVAATGRLANLRACVDELPDVREIEARWLSELVDEIAGTEDSGQRPSGRADAPHARPLKFVIPCEPG